MSRPQPTRSSAFVSLRNEHPTNSPFYSWSVTVAMTVCTTSYCLHWVVARSQFRSLGWTSPIRPHGEILICSLPSFVPRFVVAAILKDPGSRPKWNTPTVEIAAQDMGIERIEVRWRRMSTPSEP